MYMDSISLSRIYKHGFSCTCIYISVHYKLDDGLYMCGFNWLRSH